MNPIISIIIPTLNEESVIGETLKSIKSRLTLPHELIVSDGKSTDRTVEIARSIADKVVVYEGSARQTIAQGRNDGAREAKGDYLVYMDADCRIKNPDAFFSRTFQFFRSNPKVIALTVSIKVLPEYATTADKIVFSGLNSYVWLLNDILGIGISAGEFQMIRSEAFQSVGGYNEKLVASEDVDLFYRLSKIGRIGYVHDLTIYHTGRRAHKIGWPRLLSSWIGNTLSMSIRGQAISKEWKVIR